jgi:hypothetical protein
MLTALRLHEAGLWAARFPQFKPKCLLRRALFKISISMATLRR